MKEDFVVLPNWMSNDRAERVATRIDEIQDWNARICDESKGPRIVDSDTLVSLGMTPEEYARSSTASLKGLARSGNMAYLFFCKELAIHDPPLYEVFKTDFMAMVNSITGQNNDTLEETLVTMYSSGCFLGRHTDGVGTRQIAFIANFTQEDWQPDFGGCLTVSSQGRWQVIPPKFNSLVLMNVRAANCHYVSQVASWVTHKRTAISGWLGRRS